MIAALSGRHEARIAQLAEDLGVGLAEALEMVVNAGIAEMTRQTPEVDGVFDTVTTETGISRVEILGQSRAPKVVRARHMVMKMLRALGYSLPEIGRAVNKNHTTCAQACGLLARSKK